MLEIQHPERVGGAEAAHDEVEVFLRHDPGEIRGWAFGNLHVDPNVFHHFLQAGHAALRHLVVAECDVAELEFFAVLLPNAVPAFGPAGLVEQLLGLVLVVLRRGAEIILVAFLVLEQED